MRQTLLADGDHTATENSGDFGSAGRKGMILYLDVDSVTGLTPQLDVKLQVKLVSNDYIDYEVAGTPVAFAQATGAVQQTITIYPGIAADTTGNHKAHNGIIPRVFRVVSNLNTPAAAVNEVQTLTLTAGLATETFKLTYNAHESAAVVIPTGGYANVTAAQIKTALLTISDWTTKTADIAVVKTLNDYAITFSGTLGAQDISAITVTSKTGAADGSVAETTKGVVAETWNGGVYADMIA